MTSTATRSSDIIAAIESVIGDAKRPVLLHEPHFAGNEKKYLAACIDDGWVSTAGAFVERFEKELAAYCGAKHAIATVNGTCALQAALVAMGVEPDDEVLLPSLTFVATANAVSHAGAIPHFVEVEEESLGIDPAKLDAYLRRAADMEKGQAVSKASGRIIRAIVPVDVFGHPCQLEAIRNVAAKWNLVVVQDATEALGSLSHGKKVGAGGTAVLSFNGNKIITTGGGGAIVTDDGELAKKLRHLTTTARTPHAWHVAHDEVAWNYRMPNLNAALGCAQLEQMDAFIAAKRALAQKYMAAFKHISGVRILTEPDNTQSNYWLVTLLAGNADEAWLNATLKALYDAKLFCRPLWTPLHLLPMYNQCPRDELALTEQLAARIISLPSSAKLGL